MALPMKPRVEWEYWRVGEEEVLTWYGLEAANGINYFCVFLSIFGGIMGIPFRQGHTST